AYLYSLSLHDALPISLLLLGDTPRWRVLKWLFPNYHRPLSKNVQQRVRQQAATRKCTSEGEGLFQHVYAVVTTNERYQLRLDERSEEHTSELQSRSDL